MVRCSFFDFIMLAFLSAGVRGQYDSYSESYQNETSTIMSCRTDTPKTWIVNDTASATSFAEAVNCSGGTFSVTWRGNVLVNSNIYIPDGTTLYVTGEGSGAEVNGGGKTRLFAAVGADLHINNLVLRNGNATNGGAIAATRSSVFLNQTSCSGNIASSYGGAIFVNMSSSLAWEGHTVLTGNHAGLRGGAVAVSMNSMASWSGYAKFSSNSVVGEASLGGAVYLTDHSRVLWDGMASFFNNTSSEFGGALSVGQDSTASWNGEMSFVSNTASWSGGALILIGDSIVSSNGETLFANNTAGWGGGAIYVYTGSAIVLNGETSFVNNMASSCGGGVYLHWYAKVSWDGDASFVNNTADRGGGALCVSSYSSVSWTGDTSFTKNKAISNGGAIFVFTSSYVTVGGDTYFIDNEAVLDGGAAYVYVGYDDEISSYFIVDNNSTVLFQGNTCGVNGGAVVLIGEVVTRFSLNVTFWGNTAGAAGGAVYMSGVNVGIRFEGTIFMSNSAVIGGGMYSIGCGIDVTEEVNGSPEYTNPTTLIGCKFIGNEAMKTGGAMDSGAGRDMIVNTSFIGNTASLGGALRLVGTSSLMGCEFVENLSGEDEGPGISSDGVIATVTKCSFVDNAFNCEIGFFLAFDETGALFDTVCKGCDTQCSGCTIEGKEPICLEELEYSTSAGGNITLESLLIERGYWRAANTSMDILACYNTEACLGGLTGEQGYCREGYEGPYCSVCSKGYTRSLGFACNKCSDNATGGIALAIVMVIVLLLALVTFLSYILSGETEDTDQGIIAHLTRFIPLQSVKIVIVVWQILTQFATVANVVFPSVYQRFLDGVDILNFDLSWVISFECIIDTDFHDQLLLATLGPLVCIAILWGTYVAAMRRSRDSEEARGIVRRKHVSIVLLLTFLVYSSISSTLLKTFACDKLDDGKKYLRADYRIECDSFKHEAFEIYAGFMIILYVVGIPTFYGVLLYNNREVLTKNAGREDDESVKPITDLWKPYRPDRFYYEVIECVRRVLLASALVFIYPNTAAQIAVALMMATFFIFVSEALAPYASPWDTWCSRTGHAIVFTSMFLALLLKVDMTGESSSSQRVFESVLIAAHSCLILLVVVEAVAIVVAWREEVKEDVRPRIPPSRSILNPGVGRGGTIIGDDESPPPYENIVRNMSQW